MVGPIKKKVLFTSHTANFSKFNRPFMRWFKERGYEVHYASAGEEEVLDCDKHFTVPFARSPLKFSNIRAYKQLKAIIDAEKYEIIHTHTPMGSVITRLAAKKTRKKNGTRVIYTAHGFHFFKGAPLLNWLTYYPVEKNMAKYTDTLITINKDDYHLAKSRFKTDVRYIPGVGIDQDKFDQTITEKERDELRSSLGLAKDDFVMIYLAELSKRKNQLWLINAVAPLMEHNPKLHLLLAGQDSLNGKCQLLVRELKLESNVHFLGYRKDIVELLRSSDLAVSSSLQEGLPVNIMEAMYVGLPIIASDCRGNRDLIKDNESGYIIPDNNAELFRQKVGYLYVDEKKRSEMTMQGQQVVSAYLLNKIMDMQSQIYNKASVN